MHISLREAEGRMMFVPDRIVVGKGEQIRLRLSNDGEIDHEPNARRLKPKGTAEIVWHFTRAGEFDFSCPIPGHRQLGMSGTLVVR